MIEDQELLEKIAELEKRIALLESFTMNVGPDSQFSFSVTDASIRNVINAEVLRRIQTNLARMHTSELLEIEEHYRPSGNGHVTVHNDTAQETKRAIDKALAGV